MFDESTNYNCDARVTVVYIHEEDGLNDGGVILTVSIHVAFSTSRGLDFT